MISSHFVEILGLLLVIDIPFRYCVRSQAQPLCVAYTQGNMQ
jgi:hypothetical protein